jgi:hypothetical protein
MRVAIILFTGTLDNDDRVRKLSKTLSASAMVDFLVVDNKNSNKSGIVFNEFNFSSFKIITRKFLPSGRFTILKTLEFYLRSFHMLKKYDYLWVCDEEPIFHIIFAKKDKVIWDLHEHPTRFYNKTIFHKLLLSFIEKKTKAIVHANDFRRNLLFQNSQLSFIDKSRVVRNFPDMNFVNRPYKQGEVFLKFQEWCGNSEYVFVQGISSNDRYPIETLVAILTTTDFKISIIGSFCLDYLEELKNDFNVLALEDRLFVAGILPIMEVPAFMSGAKFSVVLYSIDSLNSKFCEPNRLFQPLAMGIPLIVGSNPPMREIADKYKNAVSILTDGRDVRDLRNGIKILLSNFSTYKSNAIKYKNEFIWDIQDQRIINLFN